MKANPTDATTLRQARNQLFECNAFDETSYDDPWLKIELGPFPIRLPQTKEVKRALPLHDLHHVVTGYGTDVVGEFELAAWEIGSGSTAFPEILVSNLGVMGAGLFAAPVRTFKAFARGRKEHNLYVEGIARDGLEETVGDTRARLAIDPASKPGATDAAALAGWAPAIGLSMVAHAFVLPALALASTLQERASVAAL